PSKASRLRSEHDPILPTMRSAERIFYAERRSGENEANMIHEIFPVGPLACNCSVIGDERTHEAMVIDPGDEIERVLDILKQHGLKLKMIVVTHGHIDHIGGAGKLQKTTGAPIYMNERDQMQLKLLPVQAMWIGIRPPGKVAIDQNLGDA